MGWMKLDYGNLGCKRKCNPAKSHSQLHPPSTSTNEIKKIRPKTTSKSSMEFSSLALVLGYVMECYMCVLVMGVVMVTSRADGKNRIEDSI